MSYTNIIRFVSISIVCCGLVMFLLYSTMGGANTTKNGFNRQFPIIKLTAENEVTLPYTDFYIAGYTKEQVYLGTIRKPLDLFVTDTRTLKTLPLKFPDSVRFTIQSARMAVDSPYVYLSDGITPRFFTGDLYHLKMDTFLSKSSYFTAAVNISRGSYAVRTVNIDRKENVLMKIQTDSPYVIQTTDVLTKQVDGVFCTDGQFKYDKASSRIVYMYYYRNQCLLLDTNLHLIKTIHTIDTTTVAKINIANTEKRGDLTLSSPPAFVNAAVCLYGDKIFIRSSLTGDNESVKATDKGNTIDVYSSADGHYIRSMYLPKQHRESMKDMCIVNDKLFALYAEFFITYNLPQDLLLQ